MVKTVMHFLIPKENSTPKKWKIIKGFKNMHSLNLGIGSIAYILLWLRRVLL